MPVLLGSPLKLNTLTPLDPPKSLEHATQLSLERSRSLDTLSLPPIAQKLQLHLFLNLCRLQLKPLNGFPTKAEPSLTASLTILITQHFWLVSTGPTGQSRTHGELGGVFLVTSTSVLLMATTRAAFAHMLALQTNDRYSPSLSFKLLLNIFLMNWREARMAT
jgi:hypothetical protein